MQIAEPSGCQPTVYSSSAVPSTSMSASHPTVKSHTTFSSAIRKLASTSNAAPSTADKSADNCSRLRLLNVDAIMLQTSCICAAQYPRPSIVYTSSQCGRRTALLCLSLHAHTHIFPFMAGCPCFGHKKQTCSTRNAAFLECSSMSALPDQAAAASITRRQLVQDTIYNSTIYREAVGLGWSTDGLSLDPKHLQVPGAGLNNSTAICLTLQPRVNCQH